MSIAQIYESFSHKHPEGTAVALLILSQGIISIAQAIIKHSERGILIVLGISLGIKEDFYPKGKVASLIIQGGALAISAPFFFLSLRSISMSEGLVLSAMNTIWSQVMGYYLLNEVITRRRMLNILACFIGLIIITRPQFLFGNFGDNASQHLFGCLMGLIASVLQAVSFITVKYVGGGVNSNVVTLYFHFGMIVVGGLGIAMQGIEQEYSLVYLVQLVIAALATYGCNICFYTALKLFSYSKLAPYSYSSILYSLLIDFCIFHHPPQMLSMFGGAIIIGSMIISLRSSA